MDNKNTIQMGDGQNVKSFEEFKSEIITRNDGRRMTQLESAEIEAKDAGEITAEELCEIWYNEEVQN